MAQKTILVFYDATCVLCNRSILWLIKNDVEDVFRFSHVSSTLARAQEFKVSSDAISILTEKGSYLKSSAAVLYLLQKTKRYPILYRFLKILPLKSLDVLYNIIARNRYKWFGNHSQCKIPDRQLKSKFLDF